MRVLHVTKDYVNKEITIDGEKDKNDAILPPLLLSVPRGILLLSLLRFKKWTLIKFSSTNIE